MSHFPSFSGNDRLPDAVSSNRGYGSYSTRVQLATASPTTVTTAAFVVPPLYGTVNVSVSSVVGFSVGHKVCIGSQIQTMTAGSAFSNPVVMTSYRPGSWAPGTSVSPANMPAVSSTGQVTSVTTAGWTVPNPTSASTVSLSFASLAPITTNDSVMISNYAGVYEVVSVGAATLGVRLLFVGDLPPGTTCIVDTTGALTGAAVSQGYLLGFVPRWFAPFSPFPSNSPTYFYPSFVYWTVVSKNSSTATTPDLSLGFSANADGGAARPVFGDFMGGAGGGDLVASNAVSVGETRNVALRSSASMFRIGIPPGMPIMCAVNTASGGVDYTIAVRVRGYFAEP